MTTAEEIIKESEGYEVTQDSTEQAISDILAGQRLKELDLKVIAPRILIKMKGGEA